MFAFESKDTDISFWKENTGAIHCWYDTYEFSGPIYSIPLSHNLLHWVVEGVYCSLACVKAAMLRRGGITSSFSYGLLTKMAMDVYDVYEPIVAAPPIEILTRFSISKELGLSIETFRGWIASKESIHLTKAPVCNFKMASIEIQEYKDETTNVVTRGLHNFCDSTVD
jgi:hypothetical protein